MFWFDGGFEATIVRLVEVRTTSFSLLLIAPEGRDLRQRCRHVFTFQRFLHLTLSGASQRLLVELQLSFEAEIRTDFRPALLTVVEGLVEGHLLLPHEIGND